MHQLLLFFTLSLEEVEFLNLINPFYDDDGGGDDDDVLNLKLFSLTQELLIL